MVSIISIIHNYTNSHLIKLLLTHVSDDINIQISIFKYRSKVTYKSAIFYFRLNKKINSLFHIDITSINIKINLINKLIPIYKNSTRIKTET